MGDLEKKPFMILGYEGKINPWVKDIKRKMEEQGLKEELHYVTIEMPWIDTLETTTQKDYERIILRSGIDGSPIFDLQNWGVEGYDNIIEFLKLSQRRIKSHLEK